MKRKIPETEREMDVEVKKGRTPPPEEWQVPAHLKGLSCLLCHAPFKDGDTHGEMEKQADGTIALVCLVHHIVRDPALAKRLESISE